MLCNDSAAQTSTAAKASSCFKHGFDFSDVCRVHQNEVSARKRCILFSRTKADGKSKTVSFLNLNICFKGSCCSNEK